MKQNQIVLLIVLFIIILLGASAFLLLSPKNTKQRTTLIESAPQKDQHGVPVVFETDSSETLNGRIVTKSEVIGYKVIVPSPKSLNETLSSWGVYNRKYDFGKNGKNSGGVDRVMFTLTSEKQQSRPQNLGLDQGTNAYDIYAYNSTIEIKIYADSKALAHLPTFFTSQALYPLYFMGNPPKVGEGRPQLEEKFATFLQSLKNKPELFAFEITKK